MYEKITKTIADDNELDSQTLRLLSLFFLLISGVMSFFKYTHIGWLWNSSLTFEPGFLSTIFAVFLISPLYIRGILKWNKSTYTIISLVLILLVFASFTELAIGGKGKNHVVISLLVSAVLLSWLGIKSVAGASWMLALSAGIYSAIVNNMAMGFYGFIYVGSGFIGLVLHSGLNPGELFKELKSEYSGATSSASKTINNDISNTINEFK